MGERDERDSRNGTRLLIGFVCSLATEAEELNGVGVGTPCFKHFVILHCCTALKLTAGPVLVFKIKTGGKLLLMLAGLVWRRIRG